MLILLRRVMVLHLEGEGVSSLLESSLSLTSFILVDVELVARVLSVGVEVGSLILLLLLIDGGFEINLFFLLFLYFLQLLKSFCSVI